MKLRRFRFVVCGVFALFLGGCASVPEVDSVGGDTFIVGSSGGIYTQNIAPVRAEVFRRANQYCEERGLVMIPVSVDERPYQLGGHTASVKLTFRGVKASEAKTLKPDLSAAGAAQESKATGDLYTELKKIDEL